MARSEGAIELHTAVVEVLRALPELALGLAAVVFLVVLAFLVAVVLGVVVVALAAVFLGAAVVFLVAVALAAGFYGGGEQSKTKKNFAPAR